MSDLTHLDESGHARMIDVGAKDETLREAVARGEVRMRPETLRRLAAGDMPKGDVLATARIAGIMAAKRTPDLLPLCHPLLLTHVAVDALIDATTSTVQIEATVRTIGKTGVEMEALTAVSVTALAVYDMCKAIDREMQIGAIRLVRKSGGRSGDFVND
ncbi:MAG: cyclic pyranopterin monophosphate synthase MoaC [Roseiflexus sp.]